MLKIDVSDLAAVREKLAKIQRDMQAKVLQPALNKVADKARAEINRAIPEEFNVKAAEVRNAVDIRRASGGKLEAVITVFGSASKRGRSMNMVRFLAVMQAAGRAFKTRGSKGKKKDLANLAGQLGFIIKKGGGMKKIAGAFLGNKGRTVFMREGPGRLPIKPVQVIGFAQMFRSRKINARVLDKISQEFPVEIDRALAMVLDRAGR